MSISKVSMLIFSVPQGDGGARMQLFGGDGAFWGSICIEDCSHVTSLQYVYKFGYKILEHTWAFSFGM